MNKRDWDVQEVSWEEIFRCCNNHPILREPFPIEWVKVKKKQRVKDFYCFDWIDNAMYKNSIDQVKNKPFEEYLYPLTGPVAIKGTIHTLHMLASAAHEEERAAIWLYAFLFDMLNEKYLLHGRNRNIVKAMTDAIYILLLKKFYPWHHAMRSLLPGRFFDQCFFQNAEFSSFEPLVDLAMVNADATLYNYKAILLDFREDMSSNPFDETNVRRNDDYA